MKSLKAKILLGGILAGLVSLILAAVNVYSTNQGTNALATVYENQVVPAAALKDMDRHLKEIRFRMAGVILSQIAGAGAKNQLDEAQVDIPKQWAIYKEKIQGNDLTDEAKEQIEKIDKQLVLLPPFFEKLGKAYAVEDKKTLSVLLENDWPAFQSGLLKPIAKLVSFQEAGVKETYEKSSASGKKLIFIGLAVFAVGMLVLLVGISLLSSDIHRGIQALKDTLGKVALGDLTASVAVKRKDELGEMGTSLENTTAHLKEIVAGVKRAADVAANSSTMLSMQMDQVIARTATMNDRVVRVAAAMEEIGVSNSEVANTSCGAREVVYRNEEYAQQGDQYMIKNLAAMERVVNTAKDSVGIVSHLNDSIQKISQMATVIKEIADQTNLLALNAAIEAARAGEQGRGFAVVADEVRKLAERTSLSTHQITLVVSSIRTETTAVMESMSEVEREVQESAGLNRMTDEALKQIVTSANQVTGLVGHITDSTMEQTSATEDVARSMEEISALTEENSATIRQVGQSVIDVSAVAAELQKLVGKFRV
ncbi:MAG: methyl-accepting chemotaxis protein [Gallionella sp.]|nr:methyl-accepting chemotaxis protein [Gallionella sp.]